MLENQIGLKCISCDGQVMFNKIHANAGNGVETSTKHDLMYF